MAGLTIKVEGLEAAITILGKIEAEFAPAKISALLMAEAGKPLETAIRSAAPKLTGALKGAIQAWIARRQPGVVVAVDFSKIPRPGAAMARYPYIVEHGAPAHEIRPRALGRFLYFAGRCFPVVKHPGFAGRFYFGETIGRMRRELQANVETALLRMVDEAAARARGTAAPWETGAAD